MTNEEKVRENRLRRVAKRRGLILEKSHIRDPHAIGYSRYRLVRDPFFGKDPNVPIKVGMPIVVAGGITRNRTIDVPNMTLDEVEAWLG